MAAPSNEIGNDAAVTPWNPYDLAMPSGTIGAQQRVDSASTVEDPQIELIGVRKEFSDTVAARGKIGRGHKVVAVEGADLTVGDGELFAILGPSGSGKTTVLRMVAGFEQPTAGVIRLGGVDVTALPARRRDVNTVFQEYALFPHMTVAQNVEYGLKVKGVAREERRRRTSDALDMVRLSGEASRKPAQLSGGQRQRVALARALVGRPRVLLLDEPLGALDLKLREQMQIELKEIQREVGITFVIVTHDQDEALTLCDRLAVFNNGRIEQIGNARDVYENPANRFVADFVGTSNVLDGAAAEAFVGKPGTYVVRPERIAVFQPGTDPVRGVRTADATVSEVIYAGPTTKIAAVTSQGVTLTATVLTASTWLPPDLAHGTPITLAWPEKAIHQLSIEELP
jgi:putative spermidine/putrescine transport system ATP-binding protein